MHFIFVACMEYILCGCLVGRSGPDFVAMTIGLIVTGSMCDP